MIPTPSTRRPPVRTDGGDVLESHTLRRGDTLEITPETVVISQDGELVEIAFDRIVEVSLSSYDYFLTILSIALVAFGIMSLERNLLAGIAFTAVGIGSLYRTYNRRGQLKFRVQGRAKPLIVYPKHAQAVYDALEPYVAAE